MLRIAAASRQLISRSRWSLHGLERPNRTQSRSHKAKRALNGNYDDEYLAVNELYDNVASSVPSTWGQSENWGEEVDLTYEDVDVEEVGKERTEVLLSEAVGYILLGLTTLFAGKLLLRIAAVTWGIIAIGLKYSVVAVTLLVIVIYAT